MVPTLHVLFRILAVAMVIVLTGGPRNPIPRETTGDPKISPWEAARSAVLRLPAVELPRGDAPSPRIPPDLLGAQRRSAASQAQYRRLEPTSETSSFWRVVRPLRRIPRMGSDDPPRRV